jgi:hypothetical protein
MAEADIPAHKPFRGKQYGATIALDLGIPAFAALIHQNIAAVTSAPREVRARALLLTGCEEKFRPSPPASRQQSLDRFPMQQCNPEQDRGAGFHQPAFGGGEVTLKDADIRASGCACWPPLDGNLKRKHTWRNQRACPRLSSGTTGPARTIPRGAIVDRQDEFRSYEVLHKIYFKNRPQKRLGSADRD